MCCAYLPTQPLCPLFLPSCQGAMRGNMFTHHQKTVIVDAPLHQDLHIQSEHGQQRPTSAPAMRNSPSIGRPGSHMLQRAGSRMWGNRWACLRDGTAGICGGPSACADLLPRVLRAASVCVSLITVWYRNTRPSTSAPRYLSSSVTFSQCHFVLPTLLCLTETSVIVGITKQGWWFQRACWLLLTAYCIFCRYRPLQGFQWWWWC